MASIEPQIIVRASSCGEPLDRVPSGPYTSVKRMTPLVFPTLIPEGEIKSMVHIQKAKTYNRKSYLCTVQEFGKALRTLNEEQKLSETELKEASLSFREKFQYEEYEGNVYLFPDFSSCKNEPIWKAKEKFTEGEHLFCKILQEFLPVKIILNKIVILERDFVVSLRKGYLKAMRSL